MQKGGKGFTLVEPAGRKTGFTLVEAIMVVLFIGILAAIAVPRLNMAIVSRYKAETAANNIISHLRRVRNLAISDAANNSLGFSLHLVDLDPYTGLDIVNLDTSTTLCSHTLNTEATITYENGEFDFGPLGNLTSSCTQITVSDVGKTFTITIIPATGTVKCSES